MHQMPATWHHHTDKPINQQSACSRLCISLTYVHIKYNLLMYLNIKQACSLIPNFVSDLQCMMTLRKTLKHLGVAT